MLHRPSLSHFQRAQRAILFGILLLVQVLTACYAQAPPSIVSLGEVPADGFLLKEGWRFQAGDIPDGASPQLDDRHWASIDPTQDIRDLPQIQRAGIGWLRVHIQTGPDLPPLMIKLFQSIASEIYLDGRLLYSFGTVSTNPDSVRAYNPLASFSFPLPAASNHLLALRIASQPGQFRNTKYLLWDAGAVQYWLFPATVLPALKPVDVESLYLNAFRIGIAFILFILHLSLFFSHRAQRANLYAAGMYLVLGVSVWIRAISDFSHSMDQRILLFYGAQLDRWVPGLVVLTFYSLFNFRKGWLFWLAIGSIGVKFIPLSADYQWLSFPIDYFLPLELIRLSLVALRRGLRGARLVTVCACCNMGLWLSSSVLFSLHLPGYGHEWLFHLFFLASFLCFPLTLSLLLASEHGWINRQLMAQLQEVESLSARNLAQQHEQRHLLAQQNERLEHRVAERTQELREQARQLQELDQAKTRFVNNLTHEFRTPLSLILSPVEKLLQTGRFDHSMMTLIQRNAEKLLRLINQLLDLSKLEGNFMAVSLMQGNVADFIHQIVGGFRRAAEQKGITLTCIVENLPAQTHVFDADKWEKILTNLLANAIKFTPSGGYITLRLVPVFVADEQSGVQISIQDSGIGMAPEQLPYIFDRFYQVDTSSTRAYEGTGIGLALVNELVDLLGGTIVVESEPGVGTLFRLTLPIESVLTRADIPEGDWVSSETKAAGSPAHQAPYAVAGRPTKELLVPRVLVVEDNDELREFLVGELTPAYQVLQAVDGEAGWALVQAELPAVVLTDVMMPRLDGYELTRLIRNNPDTDHIAVVMLTAKAAPQSRIDGLRQGADDYLSKPFSVNELHLRLHNLITRQQKLGDHYRQQLGFPDGNAPVELAPDPFLLRIYTLLEQHLDDPEIGVDWLSDQLAMNRKTLYRKAQTLIQLSPTELIRQYRLRRAAELLITGNSIAQTADLVGFNTPSHFSIVFKDFYQQTPTEFITSRTKARD